MKSNMDETELASMVVRLVGDGSDYKRMLTTAQADTAATANQVEATAKQIEGFGGRLKGFAAAAVGAIAALGVKHLLQEAFGGFAEAEGISLKLNAALASNGRNVEELRAKYEKFALAMEKVTVAEDDAILKTLQTAETFGVTGDNALRAAKNAIALSAQFGGSAESYVRMTAALEKGNTMMVSRLLRGQLGGIKDESEKAAKAQEILAKMFKLAEAEARSSSGQLQMLRRDWGNLLEDLGKVVAEGITPVVSWLREAIAWFRGLSDETKRTVTIVAVVAAGLVGLVGAFAALAPLIAIVGSGLAVITAAFSPIGIAVAGVTALVVALVNELVGWDAVWDGVKQTAVAAWDAIRQATSDFIEWAMPVGQALQSLWVTTWSLIKEGAVAAWDAITVAFTVGRDFIASVWQDITGGATLNWGLVRDTIVDAILLAEFVLKNFGQVAAFVWTDIQLSFVRAFNQIEHFLTVVIPTTIDWFANNWRDIFTDVFEWTKTVFTNLGTNIAELVKKIPQLISGQINFTDWVGLWKPLEDGFKRVSKELVIPERVMGDLEKQLEKRLGEQGGALKQAFDEFRKQRLGQFEADRGMDNRREWLPEDFEDQVEEDFGNLGAVAGEAMMKKTKEEVKKAEATLFSSAEAKTRIEEFFNPTPGGKGGKDAKLGAAHQFGGADAIDAIEDGFPDLAMKEEIGNRHLEKLVALAEEEARRPRLEIEAAGLV